ncbi:cytidylate kinase [Waddlia chondrophila 2032/99]|uniref:Cytidylate kinase n=1 Tax=Waddlia chondrophila 2032/99 TaxID=765953 RepID=F8LBV5_9BACT|nr:cytidylate kinase [Waddlia chondrophila 2032/99]
MIITIDGPVGTGKSTLAKMVAETVGFQFIDTGAMYRCLTYALLKHKVTDLKKFLPAFTFEVKEVDGQKRYYYENEDITVKIRQEEVTSQVSQISASPFVRNKLVELQRSIGEGVDAVFEGRDMGTVVFPNAELKIYLTASPEIRAKRRFKEVEEKFPDQKTSYADILKQVKERDERDTLRAHSPLKPATDAYIIDSSKLSPDEVLNAILLLYKKHCE